VRTRAARAVPAHGDGPTVVLMLLDHATLRDGCRVDTAHYGDDHGSPILLQHGLPSSRLTAAHAEEAVLECGVRLVSLSRPGFGRSTPTTPSLAGWGQDELEVLTALWHRPVRGARDVRRGTCSSGDRRRGGDRVTALGSAVGIGPWNELEPDDPSLVPRAGPHRDLRPWRDRGGPGRRTADSAGPGSTTY
jgi:hypothetical protein